MRKLLFAVVFAAIVCLLGFLYYNAQSETEYYTVSEYPSSWYDSKTKIEVKKTKQYESDSLAVEEETRIYHYMQEDWNRMMENAKKKGETGNVMIFSRMRDEQRCLIKITHKRSFDFEELKELIIKHGLISARVENYCESNEVELSMFPMLSDF